MLGGTLGLGIGAAILRATPALIPSGLLPAAVTPAFDVRVVLFSAAATLVVGVLFGLIPAWQATGVSLASVMTSESRSSTSRGSRLRRLLVSSEVAAAVLLLCGAGLLVKTLLTLVSGDPGYRAPGESVLTLDFSVLTGKDTRYPTDEALLLFYDAVARDVRALPEVRHAGWSSSLPYGTSELGRWSFEIDGDPPMAFRDRPTAEYTVADPGYFQTLDLPIVQGRGFNERDTLRSVPVCLVNEAFVRRHFKGRDPIGVRLSLKPRDDMPAQVREIVGVARQTSGEPDAPEELLQVYVPLAQFPIRRRLHGRAVVERRGGSADAARAARRRADRSRRAGAARSDDRSAVDSVDRRLSVPRDDGRKFRGAGARAGDDRRVRRARLQRAAAAPRDWRAHRARRERRPRDVARLSRCRRDDRGGRDRRRRAGGRSRAG